MAKRYVTVCDRCNTAIQNGGFTIRVIGYSADMKENGTVDFDLCPKCRGTLGSFINGKQCNTIRRRKNLTIRMGVAEASEGSEAPSEYELFLDGSKTADEWIKE